MDSLGFGGNLIDGLAGQEIKDELKWLPINGDKITIITHYSPSAKFSTHNKLFINFFLQNKKRDKF